MDGIHDFEDSGFFVLRTPLLPFDQLLGWGDGLRSRALANPSDDSVEFEAAWTADVQLVRRRLRIILERPEIVHALLVASPALQAGIEHWKREPDSKKGLQAERALVRYFERMSARSTPFGIFAGYSVGRVDRRFPGAGLSLQGFQHYRTSSRLDFDYLFALTSALHRDPALVKQLRYTPNTSLHRVSDAWHYVESRLAGSERSYHLMKASADEFLDCVLERTCAGAAFPELVAAVLGQSADSGISSDDAEDYVRDLVESQVLVSNLTPLLTGPPPLDDLIDQLSALSSTTHVSVALGNVRSQLAELDAKGIGASPASYGEMASALSALPAKLELERLFRWT